MRTERRKPLMLLAMIAAWLGAATIGRADIIIFESATLGETGQTGGSAVHEQILGWRFSVDQTLQVNQIGGHLYGGIQELFGAIIELSGPSALPVGSPLDPSEVIASTAFLAPSPSDDILTPLSATLTPGDYALVFGGAGLFGSGETASGAMPRNNTELNDPSYFFWCTGGCASNGFPEQWLNGSPRNTRFVVVGEVASAPVPEPTSILLLGSGLVGLAGLRRRTKAGTNK